MDRETDNKLKAISLFCGCGGSDLGLIGGFFYLGRNYYSTGIEIVHASDIDSASVETYNLNFQHKATACNIEELLLSQPDYGEQALEICEILLKSGALGVIVIDSVAALVPKAELEGEIGDSHVALQARLMSKALRKLTGAINKTKTAVIFINQLREKIGIIFGNPEVTPGGRALKFYASARIDIRRIDSIKSGTEIIGNRVRAKVVKNKVAPPFKVAEFDLLFGKGISKEGSILDVGTELGIIEKSGSWYSYKNERIGQSRENARMFLMQNNKLMEEIEEKILNFY